ncbi:Concanavalin A-like lectin/glucanase superfamily [Cynara cardunculus var. scolymus]|uniref:xyloglucan:xyloglucosyl transferase n=1 Tax=Cynara cardunculus var. scolymus TaxID=59895 RepID=A0A118JWA6_CYNCS|nr:Concanavalin A-like lectin/glucanase superfamily [Cynara cardunculus var. scolymus]
MAGFQALAMAVFVSAIAFHSSVVDGKFSKSMYFNWGAHHSSILGNGDELRLVLDKTSVFKNYQSEGIAYPSQQGMRVYSSLWNADNWATRGGLVKIDWTAAPFVANYRRFRARACKWDGPVSVSLCGSTTPANWWTSPAYKQLTISQQGQLKWARDNHMIYNYCTDYKRFNGQMPPECSKPQY